jgi:hypothetical protein
MGMQTDVKSVPVAATGTVYAARTRLKGLLVMPGASAVRWLFVMAGQAAPFL